MFTNRQLLYRSRRECFVSLFVGVSFAVCLVGCAAIARKIAQNMVDEEIPRFAETFVIQRGSIDQYRACFKGHGGRCQAGSAEIGPLDTRLESFQIQDATTAAIVGTAVSVLNDPVQQEFNQLHNYLLHQEKVDEQYTLNLKKGEFERYVAKIGEATQADGWCALREQAEASHLNLRATLQNTGGQSTEADRLRLAKAAQDSRTANYLCGYMRAYFRNGKFARLEVDGTRIKEELRRRFPLLTEEQLRQLYEYLKLNGDSWVFGEIGTLGFVTRAGALYQFPPIEARVDPTGSQPFSVSQVDFIDVGADLVRIVAEAIFDAHDGLPGVSNATGVNLQLYPLVAHDPEASEVSGDEFGTVDGWANATEGAISAGTGRLVRGAGPLALNNEAIARLIETFVGVLVRKVTEKAIWCLFSCRVCDLDDDSPANDCVIPFRGGEAIELKVEVELDPQTVLKSGG